MIIDRDKDSLLNIKYAIRHLTNYKISRRIKYYLLRCIKNHKYIKNALLRNYSLNTVTVAKSNTDRIEHSENTVAFNYFFFNV